MYESVIFEGAFGILDDAVDKELDAIDDIMNDYNACDAKMADQLIPDNIVDKETDNTNFEKYINKEE